MLVNSKKLKALRQSKNWTQQHLASVCGLSLRTIQRVESDGVASNETISAYAAIFEVKVTELIVSVEEFETTINNESEMNSKSLPVGVFLLVAFLSFLAGVSLTMMFV